MSTISEVKERLLQHPTLFRVVKGATALAQVKDRPSAQLPVAYVLSAKEVSAPNERSTGDILQRQERDVLVVIITEDLGDADGDAVEDQLEELKSFARARLVGFVPTDMQEPITHVAGEVVQAAAGAVWFEDTFSAPTYLREQP